MRVIREVKGIIQDLKYEEIDGRTLAVYIISVELNDLGDEPVEDGECRIVTEHISNGLVLK
jgi:hypothetical protein